MRSAISLPKMKKAATHPPVLDRSRIGSPRMFTGVVPPPAAGGSS